MEIFPGGNILTGVGIVNKNSNLLFVVLINYGLY